MQEDYPAFITDCKFIAMDSSISETEQLKAMLSNITRIHSLTSKKHQDFSALINEYLKTGIDIFNMETGIVSEITDETYTICDVISPFPALEKSMQFALNDTYCREVVKTQRTLGIPEVGKLDALRCHPVYQNLNLEAYLSSPIYVDRKLFGTLNFTSTHKRTFGFSENEYNMINMMANAIGNYISLRSKEDSLIHMNEKMKVFVGHVSHDLRGPIGAIMNLAKLCQKPNLPKDRAITMLGRIEKAAINALEMVSSILDQAALSTGKIHLNLEKMNLLQLIEESREAISDFANESSHKIVLDIDKSTSVLCDPHRMSQCLNNLIINAIRYSPPNTDILIHSEADQESCNIVIKNQLFKLGETPDTKSETHQSFGFGLDIVETVLQAHESKLSIFRNEAAHTAAFRLDMAK